MGGAMSELFLVFQKLLKMALTTLLGAFIIFVAIYMLTPHNEAQKQPRKSSYLKQIFNSF